MRMIKSTATISQNFHINLLSNVSAGSFFLSHIVIVLDKNMKRYQIDGDNFSICLAVKEIHLSIQLDRNVSLLECLMSEQDQQLSDSAAESRRKALKKFGRYAAAASPAMLMLLDSNRQGVKAQGVGGGRPGTTGGNPGLGNQGNSKPVGNAP